MIFENSAITERQANVQEIGLKLSADMIRAIEGPDDRSFEEAVRTMIRQGDKATADAIAPVVQQTLLELPATTYRRRIKSFRKVMHQEMRRIEKAKAAAIQKKERAATQLTAWQEYGDWLRDTSRILVMQRPDHSVLDRLMEAIEARDLFIGHESAEAEMVARALEAATSFVIEHDWAAAFDKAGDFDSGEFALPDEVCAFEMKVDGHSIVCLAHIEEDRFLMMTPMVRVKSGWCVQGTFAVDLASGQTLMWTSDTKVHGGGMSHRIEDGALTPLKSDKPDRRLSDLIYRQIRAACIALDADVATTEVHRAEYRRNSTRDHKAPTGYSYHVVSLARRDRAPRLERDPTEEPTRRRRLHFRRGHWRHYDDHKTWIKWMLVGDPDLGFVDKHYRL